MMNYQVLLPTASHAHIQRAIELLQPKFDALLRLYQRSSRSELALIGGATLLTLYNLRNYIRAKRQNLHLPPRVGYSLPIFGHLLYILRDPNGFLDWCTENYGEVFDLDLMTATVTVTAGRSAEEMLKAPSDELSLEEGVLKDVLFMHYAIDPTTFEIGFKVNPTVAKNVIPANKIFGFTNNIIKGLELGLHELIGDKDTITINKVDVFMQRFVAYMSVPSLIGPEVATNPTVIRSFADFTSDIISNVGLFLATPKFLHRFLLPYIQSVAWHRRVMKEHVAPVVRARRERMKQLGENHGLPPNFLQSILDFQKPDGSYYTDKQVAQSVLLVAFASVHTTSMNLSFCLYWLLARPDLQQRLEQEIKEVLGDGPITNEGLEKMTFLDNFIREVLRQGVDKLATTKAVLCDTYTFANGYQVPKGRRVQAMGRHLNMGLNANRAAIDEMNPDMSGTKRSTQPGRDFVTFGLGKHLCPGRFFAVHEIKISLIILFTRYNISTTSRKRSHPVRTLAGIMSLPSTDPIVLTRKK